MAKTYTRIPPVERFWPKVDKSSDCWLWKGASRDGYGIFLNGGKQVSAHRFAYELAKGPIPNGLHIDHLCRVTRCVRPDHLEAVTPSVNSLRATVGHLICAQGHPLTGENVYLQIRGRKRTRSCKTCRHQRNLAYSPLRTARYKALGLTSGGTVPKPTVKLTPDDVRAIRQLVAAGTSQAKAGKAFNVTQSNVYMIVHRKTWIDVD